ncbi:SDR family NAD(P)-dependent oxidoreductase [Timonella sp. A28]|uniref:SDR family NAD(P)-dependent oxidoreductase n=1 Tax=Timonella sp. A28 TaxID=3442640 RepID=UPI003EC10D6B
MTSAHTTDNPSTVIVTGAHGAIGAALVQRLSVDGYEVLALDKTTHANSTCRSAVFDVTSADAHTEIEANLYGMPPVRALINAAGILRVGTLTTTTDDDWNEQFLANAFGVFNVTRAVTNIMIEQQKNDPTNTRSIVTVSSNASSVPRAHMAVYAASKAAATAFTKSAGLELAEHGIRANVISPGTTRSPMLDQFENSNIHQQAITGNLTHHKIGIPLKRIAEPQDVAATASFLISPQARHLTLQDIRVDGGASL